MKSKKSQPTSQSTNDFLTINTDKNIPRIRNEIQNTRSHGLLLLTKYRRPYIVVSSQKAFNSECVVWPTMFITFLFLKMTLDWYTFEVLYPINMLKYFLIILIIRLSVFWHNKKYFSFNREEILRTIDSNTIRLIIWWSTIPKPHSQNLLKYLYQHLIYYVVRQIYRKHVFILIVGVHNEILATIYVG